MSDRTVFVLDVSGSMSGAKCQTLQLETKRFIERISDGNSVGIVLFNERAWSVYALTRISNRETRDTIIATVPQMGSGSTDIRAGIIEGLAAFTRAGISTVGANIFLATDGEHVSGNLDYVGDVLPHLHLAQVRVVCLAIGVTANPQLERLATETRGRVYNLSRVGADSREMMARIMEAAMQEVITSKEMAEVVTISVVNEILTINDSTDTRDIPVPIDPDIGRNTQIQVRSEDIKSIELDITSPSGTIFSTTGGQVSKRLELKQCQLYMDESEPGVWSIRVSKQCEPAVKIHVIVESEATGAHAIEMKVFLIAPDADCPPTIACKLCKANDPIVGAMVTATVDRPNGSQTDLSLNNYNNEGYYYGYYTDYSGTGRYNVSVLATNDGYNTEWRGNFSEQFRRQIVADSFQVRDLQASQPPTGDHFQQLLLNNAFGNMRINGTLSGQAAGGTSSGAQPSGFSSTSTNVTMLSPQMRALRDKLSTNHYRTKLAINGSKLSKSEQAKILISITDFDRYLTSIRETSVEEINSYQRRLDDINSKINLAKNVN
ncbi:unnamed protein product [Oppiella nova]|uniref:VWFA domain-containing protein n=1 Tax=Oppiella nova TaxID=334625 RepID=A0A7R9QF11_9ACAR|nr:unnamed protein product [Oppiella nova]CAG2164507.1 unnamed protein product [Oppiella nova]